MKAEHFRIKRKKEDYLHVFAIKPSYEGDIHKTIIFVHGFLGEGVENHRMFFRMGEVLSQKGYLCILFDQYGCGYSDGDYKNVRLIDLYEDIDTVYYWAKKKFNREVGFLGQSVGSALVLTSLMRLKPDFAIALNPAANFSSWLEKRYDWDLSSGSEYYYAYPKGIMVSRQFIGDLLNWNWVDSLDNYKSPLLIIAATEDDIRSVDSAYSIQKRMNKLPRIICIEGANHSFIGQRELETKAINEIVAWLNSINTSKTS